MIQRYLALKDVRTARKGQLIYVVGVMVIICLCCYNGLLLFATYHNCDPLTSGLATAKDQMMPLLVMEILKDLPGLPGLFIAVSGGDKYKAWTLPIFTTADSILKSPRFHTMIKSLRVPTETMIYPCLLLFS